LAILAAACVAGCSWILGVDGDPFVFDGFGAVEAGDEGEMGADTAPNPDNDAANADEDAAVDEDADGAVDE